MKIFAISDLHLSGYDPKPMDIFGEHWDNHWEKIKENWSEEVGQEDIVLIPGDISWAMNLAEAKIDLEAIGEMPGKKVIMKGNHDYWWSSLTKVNGILPEGMYALQNNSFLFENAAICGTRGWICPNEHSFSQQDQKIYEREIQRLKLSLDSIHDRGNKYIIAMMHYPPLNDKKEFSGFLELFIEYNVQKVIYGHLHGESLKNAFEGIKEGIEFIQVSCDYLNFKMKIIY